MVRTIAAVLLLGCPLLFAALSRHAYPEGTFWEQKRTVTEVDVNPGLGEALSRIAYGHTPIEDLYARGFTAREIERSEPGEEVHVFEQRRVVRSERRFLGILRTGEGREQSRTLARLVVRRGIIVAP